jgi:trehalose 6-phosphate phosphatase
LSFGFTFGLEGMTAPEPTTLDRHAIGLFLDVDGTILDLAPTPDAVEVPDALLSELAGVERRLNGALALVSGRPIEELDRLFEPLRLRASGVHGGEIRYAPGESEKSLAAHRLPNDAWMRLSHLLEQFPGAFAENKGVSFAVHYNLAEVSGDEVREALQRFMRQYSELPLELIGGRFVYEIKLAGFDKGKAIEHFMARPPFAGRQPIFIADDRVDRPGFEKALALGGLALSVGARLPDVSGWFESPRDLRAWLERLAE